MSHPHHHQSKRKRSKENKYPHPIDWINLLDKSVVVLGFLNVFATLPQVLEIYIGQNAAGVSSISWGYYTFFSLILLVYGFVHKETPIIITYLGSVVMYALIMIGAIIY